MSTPTEEQINHLQSLLDAGTQGEWRFDGREVVVEHKFPRVSRVAVTVNSEDSDLLVELHNLAPALLEAARELEWKRVDASEWKKLAERNQKEADDLRRAAGVEPDSTVGEGIEEILELRKENLRLREALAFYASEGIYAGDGWSARPSPVMDDKGKSASKALGKETV
jgi:hypothetical protein